MNSILLRISVIFLFKQAMKDAGFKLLPLDDNFTCRCGPVDLPVFPDIPTIVPALTESPFITFIASK